MSLSVRNDEYGQPARLAAHGDIDMAVADQLAELGAVTLRQMTGDDLVIDLGDVAFMDSTGLGALVKIRNESIKLGKHVALANVPEQVRQILAITALDEALPRVNETTSDGLSGP